jgi:Tfp pilus assembly protein PilZ
VGAKVAWRRTEYHDNRPAGIGVAFHNVSQGDKEAIRHFIDAALSRKI